MLRARRAPAGLLRDGPATNRGRKRLLVAGAVWLAAALLLALSLVRLQGLTGYYGSVSARFDTPLTGAAARGALRHAAQSGDEDGFWPTFWSQGTEKLESDLFSAEASAIHYAGEGALVYPARFLGGGWPGAADEGGCALSEALAWQLWGSRDVVGKALRVGEKTYIVRGVFAGEAPLALLASAPDGHPPGWQAAQLAGGGERPTKDAAEAFLAAAGLGEASALLVGWWVLFLARALLALPLALGALWCFGGLLQWTKGHPGARFLLVSVALLALALALPALLAALPARLVPGRWSDFSFWAALWRDFSEGFTALLSLGGTLRDLAGQGALWVQGAAGAALLAACVAGFALLSSLQASKEPGPS